MGIEIPPDLQNEQKSVFLSDKLSDVFQHDYLSNRDHDGWLKAKEFTQL